MNDAITNGIIPGEFGESVSNDLPKTKKPRKIKIIPESQHLVIDEKVNYFGFTPFLCTWREWVGVCRLVKNSSLFKEIYKNENFKLNDIEDSGYVYPVYIKEPEEIKNLDGKVVETIPGIYDENLTMVLPPKFMFSTYHKFLRSIPEFERYTRNIPVMEFPKYNVQTEFPPRDEQVELKNIAQDSLMNKKVFKGIVQCPPGWGKGIYNEILLETPSGNLRMGDIKVGDIIFGKNGKPTRVKEVYPQGNMDLYKFTFGDSTTTLVDKSHLWDVWDTDNKKWRTLSTTEILSKNYARPEKDKRYGEKSNGMRYKYFIPLCEPVEYILDISDKSRNRGLSPLQHCIHPYALGLLLGDGSFRLEGNSFTFTDKFDKNIDKLKETLVLNGYIDDINTWTKDQANSYRFSSKKLKDICKIFELDGKYSHEKHIPYEYLHASVESRKFLLDGLIATDGYTRTKSSWSYSTSSMQLKNDVCKLARSLGYYVTIKINENNSYIYKGEKKHSEHINYEICINYEKERKAITNIEIVGQGETTCIKVEAEDSLFLANDYIVTHNTYISIHIGTITGGQTMVVVPNKLLQEQWIESIINFTGLTKDDIGIIHGSDMGKLVRKGVMKKPFVICLIQSLDSQLKRNNPLELAEFYSGVSIVYYDETHTSGAADGYAKTTGIFTTCNIVGLSATPYKKDKNLFQLYTGIGTIVYISTHQNLIPTCNMHLLPIKISNKKREELYRTFEKTNYNFFMSELENFLFEDHDYFMYLSDWIDFRLNQGHSCVILFKTNKMLEKLQRYIESRPKPILSSVILTNSTAKTNKKLLHESRVILSNYKMFSAGADVPHLSSVFFASMVLGKIPIIQTLGRVTRKYAEKLQDVQAHFLLPDFIYPLYSNNEPHLTITKAVKLTYPTAQFKWDKGFLNLFEEKKKAGENLIADNYKNFQANQRGGVQINSGYNGNYEVNGSYGNDNRLSAYQNTMGAQTQVVMPNIMPTYVPPPPPALPPQINPFNHTVVIDRTIPLPPQPPIGH